MISGKYNVILADPPWEFRVWNRATGNGRGAESHYRTMTLDDICALPVSELAAPDCALFLWSVWHSIFDAEKVIRAWGFEYKTLAFEWIKLTPKWWRAMSFVVPGTPRSLERLFHLGLGYYTRANPEPCLLAVRGRMPVAVRDERNIILAPVREHSRKPDEQYEKIERLYPGRRYMELFARRQRDGWDALGDAIDGRDIGVSLAEISCVNGSCG